MGSNIALSAVVRDTWARSGLDVRLETNATLGIAMLAVVDDDGRYTTRDIALPMLSMDPRTTMEFLDREIQALIAEHRNPLNRMPETTADDAMAYLLGV